MLLDHGLYTELKDETRLSYTKLWRGILTQNEEQIKEASREIVGERYYQVFTTMIVAESYDKEALEEFQDALATPFSRAMPSKFGAARASS